MLYLANNRLLLINNGNSLYRIDSQTQPEPDSNSFIFTIDTTSGTGDSFDLPLRSGYNYDFVVDWGDGQTSEIISFDDVNKTHTYATGGEYQISITGLCEAWSFFNNNDCLKLTSIDQWGDVGFINMMNAFYGCSNLTTVNDIDGIWCSNVTNMNSMFNSCFSLVTLDVSNWNVSNVTNMSSMFQNCYLLTPLDVSDWDVSKVINMSIMFRNCSSLETLDVSNWDVSNVTYMFAMFSNCSSLTTLDVSNWDVSNVNNMSFMFYNCSSLTTLDVSKWDVSNVSDMGVMFYGCESLTTLDVSNWNVSNVTNMNAMFYNTPLDTTSYDALLNGWSGLPSLQPNVPFTANLAKYSCDAEEAHNTLTSSPNNWSIIDLGLNVDSCDEPVGGDEFKFTINTNLGTGASMTLPLRSGYNYNMTVDWGDGQTSEVTSWDDINKTHNYATHGTYQISISGICEAWYFNNSGDRLKLISIEQWGNTGFRNMQNAFRGCSNLTGSTDSDGSWCSGVINMSYMFYGCSSLTTLDVSNWDASVNSMIYMFGGCSSLTTLDVSNWNTSRVTNMSYMFEGCESLTELDVSKWDTSSVTNMGNMFNYCPSLTTLDVSNWDTSSVTNMSGMFNNCSSLTTLDVSKWNVSNVTNMNNMFNGCSSLTTLDVSSWDVSNVSYMSSMFYGCPLSTESYDAALISWSQQNVKTGVRLDANLAKYSAGAAATARAILTSTPNNWRIYDGGPVV